MKKISLKNLNTNEVEQLSREQLKNVLGGYTGGSGDGSGTAAPNCKVNLACTATITINGTTSTASGQCKMTTVGTTVDCFCDAAKPDQYTTLSDCWG